MDSSLSKQCFKQAGVVEPESHSPILQVTWAAINEVSIGGLGLCRSYSGKHVQNLSTPVRNHEETKIRVPSLGKYYKVKQSSAET